MQTISKMYNLQQIEILAAPILKRHGVEKAAVFGSFATGRANKTSDIDFIIEFGDDKSLLDLIALQMALTKSLGRKADVITYASVHRLLKDRILSEQVSIM